LRGPSWVRVHGPAVPRARAHGHRPGVLHHENPHRVQRLRRRVVVEGQGQRHRDASHLRHGALRRAVDLERPARRHRSRTHHRHHAAGIARADARERRRPRARRWRRCREVGSMRPTGNVPRPAAAGDSPSVVGEPVLFEGTVFRLVKDTFGGRRNLGRRPVGQAHRHLRPGDEVGLGPPHARRGVGAARAP